MKRTRNIQENLENMLGELVLAGFKIYTAAGMEDTVSVRRKTREQDQGMQT